MTDKCKEIKTVRVQMTPEQMNQVISHLEEKNETYQFVTAQSAPGFPIVQELWVGGDQTSFELVLQLHGSYEFYGHVVIDI